MEDGSRLPGSRKRHRSDELPSSAFRLTRPSEIVAPKSPRLRAVGNQSNDNDLMLANPADTSAPLLQPLHPPIPNFSAISQGAPRPNNIPHTTAEPPGGIIYNIALPLPNPGRAHRFCQACDHVNHVRRKLCTNCGAPKPSAVRNAVGVRSISDVDLPSDRGSQPPDSFGSECYFPRQVASQSFGPSGGFEIQNRFSTSGFGHNDQRGLRTTDNVVHQARSLAMRCPGDDIPLLGISQRSGVQQVVETQPPRRIRGGQTVLGEPLINLNSFQSGDGRNQGLHGRQQQNANIPDSVEKIISSHHLDRDQVPLPSMQGMSGQKLNPAANQVFRTIPRSQGTESRIPRASGLRLEKGAEDGLSGDLLPLNHGSTLPESDMRPNMRRYQNMQHLRHPHREVGDANPIYDDIQDNQGNGGLLYRQNQDFFQSQPQYRGDERDNIASVQTDLFRRQIVGQGQPLVSGTGAEIERDYSSPTVDHSTQREQRCYSRLPQELLRYRMERSRPRNISEDSRGDPVPLRQSMHVAEHGNTAPVEEHSRQADDSRFAIENILMQHKTGGSGE